jgi:hypothetical protein
MTTLMRQLWIWLAPLLFPLLVLVGGMATCVFSILLWRRRSRHNLRRSPLTRGLLRTPGHSLRLAIEEVQIEISGLAASFALIPVGIYSIHLSQSYFAGTPETMFRGISSILITMAFAAVIGVQLFRLLERKKTLVLGLQGELATGEELNQLLLDGCRVFHDIEILWGNIDHVVVSQSGVFAVETKMLGKPKEGIGTADAVVDHHTNLIQFPDRTYRIPYEQLDSQAKWLSQFLSAAVGEHVGVESILALPGWFIKERVGRGRVYVINPLRPKKFFVHGRNVFSDVQVQRIAHQLEQLCRNVEPSFRKRTISISANVIAASRSR